MPSEFEARLAATLGDLEDIETELVNKQTQLARDLSQADAELKRVRTVKAIIHGKPTKKPPSRPGGGTKKVAEANREKVLEWARTTNGDWWLGTDAAEAAGIHGSGIAPVLGGLVRRGVIERQEREGKAYFRLTEGSNA